MSKLKNIIVLLVGKSGSGKTTLANQLSNLFGYEVLNSYTTRPKRSENETGHIFIDVETYETLPNKVATTLFNGYEYCATKEQIDSSDIYVIDPFGVQELKKFYTGDKKLVTIYLDVPMELCLERMRRRKDSEDECWRRLRNDDIAFKDFRDKANHVLDGVQSVKSLVPQINNRIIFEEHYWNRMYINNFK